jgi:hypothetical protein
MDIFTKTTNMYLQTKAYKELFRNYIGGIIPPPHPRF